MTSGAAPRRSDPTARPLQVYLHDHLAGAEAGVQLVSHLVERHAGTAVAHALAPVRDEIVEDRAVLRQLAAAVGEPPTTWKEAAGWLAERLARLKLEAGTDPADPLPLFEALEALALGILGKRHLWSALRATRVPIPPTIDLAHLEARADRQHEVVDRERMAAARLAFGA